MTEEEAAKAGWRAFMIGENEETTDEISVHVEPDWTEEQIKAAALREYHRFRAAAADTEPEELEWWVNHLEESGVYSRFNKTVRRIVMAAFQVDSDKVDETSSEAKRTLAILRRQYGKRLPVPTTVPGVRERFATIFLTNLKAWADREVQDQVEAEGLSDEELTDDEYDRRFRVALLSESLFSEALEVVFTRYALDFAGDAIEVLRTEDNQQEIRSVSDQILERIKQNDREHKALKPANYSFSQSSPQYTFPEMKAATIALTDAVVGRRWAVVEGEIALRHRVDNQPIEVKFVGGPVSQWLGSPRTIASLWSELGALGLSAVLAYHVCVDALLHETEPTIAIDAIIKAIGMTPRTTAEREAKRAVVWRWLAVFSAWEIVGRRKSTYRVRGSREPIDLETYTPLIQMAERAYFPGTQLALDASAPPAEVTIRAGTWLNHLRGNKQVLSYFGDVRRLAAIPAGKPSGAWAQAIGLALQQKWRERASRADVRHVGDGKKLTAQTGTFTRRELLDLFAPIPTVDDVLESDHPNRAQKYWDEAIAALKEFRVVGFYSEIDPRPTNRKGWASDWLKQRLDIRPNDDGKEAIVEIHARAVSARKSRNKKVAAS